MEQNLIDKIDQINQFEKICHIKNSIIKIDNIPCICFNYLFKGAAWIVVLKVMYKNTYQLVNISDFVFNWKTWKQTEILSSKYFYFETENDLIIHGFKTYYRNR